MVAAVDEMSSPSSPLSSPSSPKKATSFQSPSASPKPRNAGSSSKVKLRRARQKALSARYFMASAAGEEEEEEEKSLPQSPLAPRSQLVPDNPVSPAASAAALEKELLAPGSPQPRLAPTTSARAA